MGYNAQDLEASENTSLGVRVKSQTLLHTPRQGHFAWDFVQLNHSSGEMSAWL